MQVIKQSIYYKLTKGFLSSGAGDEKEKGGVGWGKKKKVGSAKGERRKAKEGDMIGKFNHVDTSYHQEWR